MSFDARAAAAGYDPDDGEFEQLWQDWLDAETDSDIDPELLPFAHSGAAADSDDQAGDPELEQDALPEPPLPAPARPAPSYPPAPCWVTVGQGDCLLSLARRYRLPTARIWQAAENAELRAARPHNQLLPGDRLFVPARETKGYTGSTDQTHHFRLLSPRNCTLRLRFLEAGEPLAGIAYSVLIDGNLYQGKTDTDGLLEQRIAADARGGEVVLHRGDGDRRYPLRCGYLNPLSDLSGAQARLNHLGYPCGPADGRLGPRTRRALRAFQLAQRLPISGEPDAATRTALQQRHAS